MDLVAQTYSGSMKCKVEGKGYSDETIIAFVPGATSGFDALYDSWKLFSLNPNVPSIYTSIPGGHLSINSQTSLEGEWEEALYVKIPDTGSYTLQFKTIYPFDSAVRFSLYDSLHNQVVAVTNNSNYQFSISNMASLNNGLVKFRFNVHLPSQFDSIIQPNCIDSLAEVTISRNGDSNYTCFIVNALMDTLQVVNATTDHFTLNNLTTGNYQLITELDAKQFSFVNFEISDQIRTLAEFEMMHDSLLISANPVLEVWDKSINNNWASWDFDDGTNFEFGEHVMHTYLDTGLYAVTLVAGNDNCKDTIVHYVKVYDLPTSVNLPESNEISTYCSSGILHINSKDEINSTFHLSIYTFSGQLIQVEEGFFAGKQRDIAISPNQPGNLIGVLQTKQEQFILKFPNF